MSMETDHNLLHLDKCCHLTYSESKGECFLFEGYNAKPALPLLLIQIECGQTGQD